MASVRWFAVVFAVFQVLTFTVPYPPGYKEAALVLTGLLAAGNFVLWRACRSGQASQVARLAPASLALDLLVLIGFVFIYTFDPETSIWAVIYVAPLEGALLYQKRGALLTMGVAALLYAVRELVGSVLFDYEFLAVSVTFRMGIGFIIAAVAGAATEHLVEERDRVAASEERLEAILRNSRDGIVVVEADGGIRYASSAMERLLGYSPQDLKGRYVWELLEPADSAEAQTVLMSATTDAAPSAAARATHRDGTLMWLEMKATDQSSDPAIGGILLNVHDVTERKLAENELAEANQRLGTVLSNLPGMAYRCANDERWTMQYISAGVRSLTGYAPEELLPGSPIEYGDLIHPADQDRVWAEVQAALERHEPFQLEYRIVTATGREKWVWEQGRAVTPEGEILEGLVIDATERKHLETALAESQKMEAIGRLAGGIAHDFNNILSVVINFADLLLDAHRDDQQLQEDLRDIRDAGNRGAGLVRQLLTFSRRDSAVLDPVVVSEVLHDMANLLRKAAGETVSVELEAESAAAVLIDRTKLEQVLLNLVVNARDAVGDKGQITISTKDRVVVDGFSSATGRVDPGEYVVLSVDDTGQGMSPEVVEHIFEPFFTTKDLGQGTGLGLSTVYGIVQASAGHISVDSHVGRGTTFSIYLPATIEGASADPDQRHAPGRDIGRKTILVVEDESSVRAVVERILARRGHEVYTAVDGRDALERLSEQPIELLVSDVAMPRMSGPALVQRLREQGSAVPVIFMSGYDDGSLAKHSIDERNRVLLKKPFSAEALVEAVREVFEERQP